jgi:hypothetical protein
MYTFIVNGCVAVSPNSLLPPPFPASAITEDHQVMSDGHHFRIMSHDYPQLPYCQTLIGSGPLFSCLAYKRSIIPIIHRNALYEVRPDLLKKWVTLDRFLTKVFNMLAGAPMNIKLHPVPLDIPYA